MSDIRERVFISATEDGNLDINIPEGSTERPLQPIELLLLGVFLRASEDTDWATDLMDWTVSHYKTYFEQDEGQTEAAG
jgi:hypothetical protein